MTGQAQGISPASKQAKDHGVNRHWSNMQDVVNLGMLVCAALASMGLGVFAAYAIFKGGFALMRWHTQQQAPAPLKATTKVARVS